MRSWKTRIFRSCAKRLVFLLPLRELSRETITVEIQKGIGSEGSASDLGWAQNSLVAKTSRLPTGTGRQYHYGRRAGRLSPDTPSPAVRRYEKAFPNEAWQVDFKGHHATALAGRCHPLTVTDDHSRFNILLKACPAEQAQYVFAGLIHAFAHMECRWLYNLTMGRRGAVSSSPGASSYGWANAVRNRGASYCSSPSFPPHPEAGSHPRANFSRCASLPKSI